MSRFRRTPREVPGLNLAALPDLIFTVLFFFMIVTHMRDVEPKVRYQVWQLFVSNAIIEKEAEKLGLTVTISWLKKFCRQTYSSI